MQEFTLNEMVKQLERIEKKVNDISKTINMINMASIVNKPEPKGMWTASAEGTICSRCGYKLTTTGLMISHCPHCGANMLEDGILVYTGPTYTNMEDEK